MPVRILVPLNAPSRMASAMNVYADIETNLQHYPSAMFWRRAAEETYLLLDLQPGYQSTRAARLGLQGRLGDYADIAREVADIPATDPLHKAQQSLLAADLALHEDRLEDARRALDRAAQLPLSLRDQIRLALLDATIPRSQRRRRDGAAGVAGRRAPRRCPGATRRQSDIGLRHRKAIGESAQRGVSHRAGTP